MKKLLFCLAALVAVTTATAQNEAVWGVRAGMNIANLKVSGFGMSASADSRISYNVGVAYQQPLARRIPLYLETGLYLSDKGTKMKGVFDDSNIAAKMHVLYLQLPVAISWHFDMKNISLQPSVGAYYALGVYGKGNLDGTKFDLFKATTVGDDSFEQSLKRSDVGLRFGLGMAVKKHYYIGVSYDLGLSDIAKTKTEGMKFKTTSFQVMLGYNF